MADVIRVTRDESPLTEVRREWLVTNGHGGYASATISGAITRRYHGFLIAALPPPLGRMVVLNDLDVEIERADGTVANLREQGRFIDFTLKMGLPSWRHEIDGRVIEKSVVLSSGHDIVYVTFRLRGDDREARLRLRPFINFRALEAPVDEVLASGYGAHRRGDNAVEVAAGSRSSQHCTLPSKATTGRRSPPMGGYGESASSRSKRSAASGFPRAGCGLRVISPGPSASDPR